MKKILFLIALGCASFTMQAQQYPESQLYMANPYMMNPGFTGYLTDLSIYAGAQSPFSLGDNEVRNYYVGINQSLENKYLGVGGKIMYDQRAFFESIYLDASVSYRAVVSNKHVISMGADVGLVNRTYNIGHLTPYVDMNDPTLSSDYYYQTSFKAGFGVAYYSEVIEAGLAAPFLVEGSEDFSNYYNGYLAYKIYLDNDRWILKPNLVAAHLPDGTVQASGHVMFERRGMFWGQVGYDSSNSLHLATGWMVQSYEIVYGHRLLSGDQLPYTSRGEVMLRIHLGKSNKRLSHIASPRNKK